MIKGRSANRQKRCLIKKIRKQLKDDFLPRKQGNEEARKILEDFNSFSKTNHDASLMRMKENPIQNEQLKPGYNVQTDTDGQYVLDFDIFLNPTDTRTLKPFFQSIHPLDLFKDIVQIQVIAAKKIIILSLMNWKRRLLFPIHTMYPKELIKKYQTSTYNPMNWEYLEDTNPFISPTA